MGLLRACLVWLILALPGHAQGNSSSVLIVDLNRLYSETLYGRRLIRELNAVATEMQEENNRIRDTLLREERDLTLRRPDMTPEAFRAEAELFDAKVEEVRRVRDAKEIELQVIEAQGLSRFEDRVEGILESIRLERGAFVVLEKDSVLLAAPSANITDEAIVRIDAELGDGTE